MQPTRRELLGACSGAMLSAIAGCGESYATPPGTTTVTYGTVTTSDSLDFPEGPLSQPKRPANLTAETAREYAMLSEYRRTFNLLADEGNDIEASCHLQGVREIDNGYEVMVCCYGTVKDNELMDDYPAHCFLYTITPDGTTREGGPGTVTTGW